MPSKRSGAPRNLKSWMPAWEPLGPSCNFGCKLRRTNQLSDFVRTGLKPYKTPQQELPGSMMLYAKT